MSGIFAALIANEKNISWLPQLNKASGLLRHRGDDGTKVAAFGQGKWIFPPGGKIAVHGSSESPYSDYTEIVGCAYSRPISLEKMDAGPFIADDGSLVLCYDGVVSGYTGAELVEFLRSDTMTNWTEKVQELDGQFAVIAIQRNQPRRIYYAVKAKPLFILSDVLGRGLVLSSSKASLYGMYHPIRNPCPYELEPYTCGHISIDGVISGKCSLVRFKGDGTLVLSGGGLDTLVAAYDARRRYPAEPMALVYFDYGAKASLREFWTTEILADSLNKRFTQAKTTVLRYDLSVLQQISASSLTDERVAVSTNPQAGKPSEWVPARNTVMMSIALAIAESSGFARIVTGINQDAATAYPDNDSEWNARMQAVVPYALGPDRMVQLEAPLSALTKVGIVRHGVELKIPWRTVPSWSCYSGGEIHCGLCSSCRARRKAFRMAQIEDPTEYSA